MSVLLPILLPERFTSTVHVGEHVKKDQVIATAPTQRRELTIDIAQQFSVPRRKARHLLQKNAGDSLTPGDIIAKKKGVFGRETRLISDGYGTVKRYERDSGKLVIIGSDGPVATQDNETSTPESDVSQSLEMKAPLDGVVTEMNTEKIILTTDKPVLVAKHGAGGSVQAELVVLPSAHTTGSLLSEVTPHEINSEVSDRVVLGGVFDREDLVKCTSLGVVGIIGGTIDKDDIHYLLGKNMLLPLIQVDEHVWKDVAKAHNKQVFLDADNGTILVL